MRAATLGLLIGTILPSGVSAQRATLSPNLQPVLSQDTVVAVWLFVSPTRTLDDAAQLFPGGLQLAAPPDTVLASITPTFQWTTDNVASFGLPVTYRLRLARDIGFQTVFLDTTTSSTSVTLAQAQQSGDTIAVEDATTLERRPTFRWQSPMVAAPPGPFRHIVEIFRADDQVVEAADSNLTTTSFTPPSDLTVNTPYRWRVTTALGADTVTAESTIGFLILSDDIPRTTALLQNFPNPFPNLAIGTSTTCLWFDLATRGTVGLQILDLRGHIVRTLVPFPGSDGTLEAGRYGRPATPVAGNCDPDFTWDGTANDGSNAPRGVYIAMLVTSNGTFTKRIVYLGRNEE